MSALEVAKSRPDAVREAVEPIFQAIREMAIRRLNVDDDRQSAALEKLLDTNSSAMGVRCFWPKDAETGHLQFTVTNNTDQRTTLLDLPRAFWEEFLKGIDNETYALMCEYALLASEERAANEPVKTNRPGPYSKATEEVDHRVSNLKLAQARTDRFKQLPAETDFKALFSPTTLCDFEHRTIPARPKPRPAAAVVVAGKIAARVRGLFAAIDAPITAK